MTTTPQQWQKVMHLVCEQVKFPVNEETGTAWNSGGCYMFARTLRRVLGGKIKTICSYDEDSNDYPVQHFVLSLNGYLYDSTGRYPVANGVKLITEHWPKSLRNGNVLKSPHCTNVWVGEHFYDPILADELYFAMVEYCTPLKVYTK